MRRRIARIGSVVATVAALMVTAALPAHVGAAAAPAPDPVLTRVHPIGASADGRPLRLVSRGTAAATTDVLVVGIVHGNETAGLPVVQRLARTTPPAGVRYWLLASLNPDGQRRATRQNRRGVDLNRNFPLTWRGGGRPFDVFYPGRAAASEPETRAAMRAVDLVRPDVTVWYHQHRNMTVRPPLPWRVALATRYAQVSRLPLRTYPGGALHGTASAWQHLHQPYGAALVIELPAGPLDARGLARHVAAVDAVARAAATDGVVDPADAAAS